MNTSVKVAKRDGDFKEERVAPRPVTLGKFRNIVILLFDLDRGWIIHQQKSVKPTSFIILIKQNFV